MTCQKYLKEYPNLGQKIYFQACRISPFLQCTHLVPKIQQCNKEKSVEFSQFINLNALHTRSNGIATNYYVVGTIQHFGLLLTCLQHVDDISNYVSWLLQWYGHQMLVSLTVAFSNQNIFRVRWNRQIF